MSMSLYINELDSGFVDDNIVMIIFRTLFKLLNDYRCTARIVSTTDTYKGKNYNNTHTSNTGYLIFEKKFEPRKSFLANKLLAFFFLI